MGKMSQTILYLNCNESLDSGDIIGGYGELNWIYAFRDWLAMEYSGNDYKIPFKKLPIFINGVETIQEMPKLKWWITLYMVNV